MADLKAFRKANGLTQVALGKYLGVNHSFIGNIESGRSSLPADKLDKLLSNDKGWDTTALSWIADKVSAKDETTLLKAENAYLRDKLAKVEEEKERYWEMIQKLMK